MMDFPSISQTPLLFLTFLEQSPHLNSELQRELGKLHCDRKLTAHCGLPDRIAYRRSALDSDVECDGELQTDGHSYHRDLLLEVPEVDLILPVPAEEAQAVREVAAELIRMADEFNNIIATQAADRLIKKISSSSPQCLWNSLTDGVDHLLKEVPGMHNERMVMALTFSLARAVCKCAPRLLRDICTTLTHHSFVSRSR